MKVIAPMRRLDFGNLSNGTEQWCACGMKAKSDTGGFYCDNPNHDRDVEQRRIDEARQRKNRKEQQ